MPRARHTIFLSFALVLSAVLAAFAALPRAGSLNRYPVGGSTSGARMIPEIRHDTSLPLRTLVALYGPGLAQPDKSSAEKSSPEDQNERAVLTLPTLQPLLFDPVLQSAAAKRLSVMPGLNFDGISTPPNGWIVPDTNGAVGATQFVEWVNVSYAVYNKTTKARILGPLAGNTLWNGFGGLCQTKNSGDIIAQYDKAAARWVMTQHATPKGGPYYQCVAVSTTSDATGSYNRYAFQLTSDFPDYPKLGVWPDAYYLSTDLDNPSGFGFLGSQACALDRNAMLAGSAATAQCFQTTSAFSSLLPSDLDGLTAPPAGSPDYFVNLGTNSLNIWQFHVDFTNPANSTFTGPVNVPAAAFSEACGGGICVPQLGTSQTLDSLGDRLMYRLAYRNFGDHEALVVNHSVVAGTSGGVRWYEIRDPGGSPFIFQQGTYAPDANWRWMGSVAMDKLGDIAAGYSVSSNSINPGIRVTGRVPTDPLGTFESEINVVNGTGSEIGSFRWGDYSSLSVDPSDDCTFWYSGEYLKANGDHNWRTRIASFKFSSCM